MVGSDDNSRRTEHSPVSIKRQERERAKDMEVGFNAASGEVNQQGRHKHLSSCNHIAGADCSWLGNSKNDREETNCSTEKDCGPYVNVSLVGSTLARPRRMHHWFDN